MKLHIISFVIIVYFAHLLQGEKILFYFAVSGYSHRISVWPIIEKLADSGHSVTLLSPYPAKVLQSHPNITDYVPEGLATDLGIMDLDFIGLRLTQGVAATDNLWDVYYKLSISACEALMRKQEFIEWVTRSSFDLVVVNALYNECGYGLVHKFQSKHVVYYPSSHLMW
jgi:glucuronosyltransferase